MFYKIKIKYVQSIVGLIVKAPGEIFGNNKVEYSSVVSQDEVTYVLKYSIYFGLRAHLRVQINPFS